MKLYIACDHRGTSMKDYLIKELEPTYNIIPSAIQNSSEDDYPDFAFDIATEMDKKNDLGILICGTGVGISIAANKVQGIRCARVNNIDDAISSRQHNHANIIALPAYLSNEEALKIIEAFLNTDPSMEERHLRRINKIISYEKAAYNEL